MLVRGWGSLWERATATGSGLCTDSFPEGKPWSQPPAPHTRQLSSSKNWAHPAEGVGMGRWDQREGLQACTEPDSPAQDLGISTSLPKNTV